MPKKWLVTVDKLCSFEEIMPSFEGVTNQGDAEMVTFNLAAFLGRKGGAIKEIHVYELMTVVAVKSKKGGVT